MGNPGELDPIVLRELRKLNDRFSERMIREKGVEYLEAIDDDSLSLSAMAQALGLVDLPEPFYTYLDEWPDDAAEAVRGVLRDAIARGHGVAFHWQHGDDWASVVAATTWDDRAPQPVIVVGEHPPIAGPRRRS